MDLKELCKKVDRIAILEKYEPDYTVIKRSSIKKRSRSGNTSRYVFYFLSKLIIIAIIN